LGEIQGGFIGGNHNEGVAIDKRAKGEKSVTVQGPGIGAEKGLGTRLGEKS